MKFKHLSTEGKIANLFASICVELLLAALVMLSWNYLAPKFEAPTLGYGDSVVLLLLTGALIRKRAEDDYEE